MKISSLFYWIKIPKNPNIISFNNNDHLLINNTIEKTMKMKFEFPAKIHDHDVTNVYILLKCKQTADFLFTFQLFVYIFLKCKQTAYFSFTFQQNVNKQLTFFSNVNQQLTFCLHFAEM